MKANTLDDFRAIINSIVPNERGCLIWPRKENSVGYGYFKINRNRILAHRLVLIANGVSIQNGLCVMHTCDVPMCVNIDHLKVGTWADNNRDRMRKGRSALGEKSGRVKLSDDKVRSIRALYATGQTTCDKLGKQFNVSNHQISQVVTFKNWRHIV